MTGSQSFPKPRPSEGFTDPSTRLGSFSSRASQGPTATAPGCGPRRQLHRGRGLSARPGVLKAARNGRWGLWHPRSMTVSGDQGQEKQREGVGVARACTHSPQSWALPSVGLSLEKHSIFMQLVSSSWMWSWEWETC